MLNLLQKEVIFYDLFILQTNNQLIINFLSLK